MIVLDTHAWLWWWSEQPEELSPTARSVIDGADTIGVPAVCCFEVVQAEIRGRIVLDRDVQSWIAHALQERRVRLLPLTAEIAVGAARLVWDHKDPLDRMVVATSTIHGAPLVTRDERIRRFQGVQTIW